MGGRRRAWRKGHGKLPVASGTEAGKCFGVGEGRGGGEIVEWEREAKEGAGGVFPRSASLNDCRRLLTCSGSRACALHGHVAHILHASGRNFSRTNRSFGPV